MRTIQVNIFPEPGGGYFAEAPGLPGCYVEGRTLREIQSNLPNEIAFFLEDESEFLLSFELRAHELRTPPGNEDKDTETFESFDTWLREMSA